MVFNLEILPISINRLYIMSPHGRYLIHTREGMQFIEYAKGKFIQQIKEQGFQKELLALTKKSSLKLRLDFCSPDWITAGDELAVRSLDNLPRAVQEALTAAIKTYNGDYNDCTIVELIVRKKISDKTATIAVLERM